MLIDQPVDTVRIELGTIASVLQIQRKLVGVSCLGPRRLQQILRYDNRYLWNISECFLSTMSCIETILTLLIQRLLVRES